MKRVLVTGATGFVGRHTIPYLINRGYEVHALSRSDDKVVGVYSHKCDLFNERLLVDVMQEVKPSHLLHLAWYVEHGKFYEAAENLLWVEASLRLIRIFSEYGGKRVVVTGTCAEYDWSYELLSENETPVKPVSKYALAKYHLMQLLTQFSENLQVSLAWCRIFFLYGPFEFPGRLIPYIINQLLNNREVTLKNDTSSRDFLHIEDAAHAIVATLDSEFEGPVNIASGNAHRIGDIANEISTYLTGKLISPYASKTNSDYKSDSFKGDTNILTQTIGFSPHYDLPAGLKNTVDWWNSRLEKKCDYRDDFSFKF